jgi:hypothetical protein
MEAYKMDSKYKKRYCPSFLKGPRKNFPAFLFSKDTFKDLTPHHWQVLIVLYFHILRDQIPHRPLSPLVFESSYNIPRSTLYDAVKVLKKKEYIFIKRINDKTYYSIAWHRFFDDWSAYTQEAYKHVFDVSFDFRTVSDSRTPKSEPRTECTTLGRK